VAAAERSAATSKVDAAEAIASCERVKVAEAAREFGNMHVFACCDYPQRLTDPYNLNMERVTV